MSIKEYKRRSDFYRFGDHAGQAPTCFVLFCVCAANELMLI